MIPRANLVKDLGRLFFWYPVRWLVLALPLKAVYWLGGLLGRVDELASGRGRLAAMGANIRRGLGLGEQEARAVVRANLMNHARNNLEFIKYPQLSPANLERAVSFEGLDKLDAALARGKGVILTTAHYGAKQMLQAGLGHKGYAMTQLHIHLEEGELTRVQKDVAQKFRKRIEAAIPCAFVSSQGFIRPALECLKRGEVLLVAADGIGIKKYMARGYEPFSVLGQNMLMPLAWVGLARRTGAAALPAFVLRQGHRQLVLIEEELDLSGDDRQVVARYAERLQHRLRQRPELWEFWEEFDQTTLLAPPRQDRDS